MALTRITKGVIKPNENYDTHNIVSTGIVTSVGLDVNGNGDISGDLNVGGILTYEDVTSIDSVGIITAQKDIHVGAGVSAVGVGSFGSLDIGGDIDVDGHTNLDNVSVAGVSTFAGAIDLNADLDVDGHTNLDNVSVAGVSTFAGAITANGAIDLNADLDVDGHTNLDNISITGVTTITSAAPELHFTDTNANSDYSIVVNTGQFRIRDETNGQNRFAVNSDGHSDFYGRLDANSGLQVTQNATFNNDLDVDGHTNLDNVSIAGVTTITGRIFAGGTVIPGYTGADDLTIGAESGHHGITIRSGNTSNGGLFFSDETSGGDNSNQWAGGIEYSHNSSELRFYTGNAYRSSMSGAGHFIPVSDSQLNIGSGSKRFANIYSDNLNLSANAVISGDLDVDGHTNLDNVSVAGVTTITANNVIGLNVENSSGSGAQTTIRSKSTVANASNFVRSESSDNKYIGLLKYGTGHSAYGALAAGGGAVYANSSVPITIMSDGGYINFATGGNTERLRITSGGNVNIGGDYSQTSVTAQITGDLLVQKTASAYLNPNIDIYNYVNGGYAGSITFSGKIGGSKYSQARIRAYGGSNTSDGALAIETGNMNEKFRITSDGKVGINENSPDTFLHVKGNETAYSGNVAVGAILTLQDTVGRVAQFIAPGSAGDAGVGTKTNHHFQIFAGNSPKVFVNVTDSSTSFYGDVNSVDTTSGSTVTRTLKVGASASSGTNNGTIVINNGGLGNASLQFDYESSAARAKIYTYRSTNDLIFDTSGVEKFRIFNSGDIAIPTVGAKIYTNNSGGNLTIQGGATYPGSAIKFNGGANGGTGVLHFYTGQSTSLEERMQITAGGNIETKGLGTFEFNDGWSAEGRNVVVFPYDDSSNWFSFIGTGLRFTDGGNFVKPSDAGNSNWGNIAGIAFEGSNNGTDPAIRFVVDTPGGNGSNYSLGSGSSGKTAAIDNKSAMTISSDRNIQLRQLPTEGSAQQKLQWISNSGSLSAQAAWGQGSANFDFSVFRTDSQSNYPYGNFRVLTGHGTSPIESLKVTVGGQVLTPRQPSFAVYRNQSTWNVNGNYMVFNTARHNIGGHYDTSNGRFTAPVTGSYQINFYSIYKGNHTNAYVQVRINGARIYGGDTHFTYYDLGSNWDNVSYSQVVYLNVSDYVQMYSPNNVDWHGNHWQCFSGYLIG